MCFIGAASAIAAAFCFWLVDNQRKATATLGAPILLGGITTISLVVSTYLALSWVSARERISVPSVVATPPPMPEIFIECHLTTLPTKIPEEKRFLALSLWPVPKE